MCEKLPSKNTTDLGSFELFMAVTSEFLYQYNVPSIKVNFVIYVTSGIGGNEQKRQGTKNW
jgi:hypothetical protein